MTTAVLFDLEDTLVQTPWSDFQRVLKNRRETKEKLIQLGIPPSVLEGVERATIMHNLASGYAQRNFDTSEAKRFREGLNRFRSTYEIESAQKSTLFPETIETLEKLKSLGLKLGLITNTSFNAVKIIFDLHGLEKFFDVVITRENVKLLKPDPEGILLALEKLGANQFFMVGDLIHDALAAKNAKGKSIIVKRSPKECVQADFIVRSLAEVPDVVQAEGGNDQRSE